MTPHAPVGRFPNTPKQVRVSGHKPSAPDGKTTRYRTWWVFYIDPEKDDHQWRTAGVIGGRFTADEAIKETVGRRFFQSFWAFALEKGADDTSFYDLHYPKGDERTHERRLGPAGYVAEVDSRSVRTESATRPPEGLS